MLVLDLDDVAVVLMDHAELHIRLAVRVHDDVFGMRLVLHPRMRLRVPTTLRGRRVVLHLRLLGILVPGLQRLGLMKTEVGALARVRIHMLILMLLLSKLLLKSLGVIGVL